MKKVVLSVLIICLVFAGLFVSCKNEIEVPADELVSVGFSNSGSRALSSNLEAFNPSDYYWAYAAQKADNSKLVSGQTANYGLDGEVTLWVKTDTNGVPVKGLGDSNGLYQVPGFSQGLWNFKLYAFKNVSVSNSVYSGTGLLYKGETTGVLLKSSATNEQGQHSVNVIVSPVSNTSENGTLVIKTKSTDPEHITMTLFGTYTSENAPVFGTDYFPRIVSITKLDETSVSGLTGGTISDNGVISLPAGTYKVTFAFADDDENPTVNYARGSVIATVYSNLTTTIKGNLLEADVYAEFSSNQSINTVTSGTGTDAVEVATIAAAAAPSSSSIAEPGTVNSSNVANTQSAKTTISSSATAVTVAEDRNTTVTIPAAGLADTVVTKTLTAKTDDSNKTVTTVTETSSHDLSLKLTDAGTTAPSTVVINAGTAKVAGVNLTLTKTTTTVTETATTTSGNTETVTTSTTADPQTITSFNDKYVTVSTYVDTGLVDVNVLYDGASQNGLVFDTANSSPSVEIASNNDGNSAAGTGYNPNTGLLVFKTNHFSSYIVTCAPTLVVKQGETTVASYASLAAFRDAVNSGTSFAGQTVELQYNIDLAGISWTPIGTSANPFRGTFDGNGKTINNLSNHGFTAETIDENYNSGSSNSFALFGYLRGNVTIKDLTVYVYAADKKGKGYAGVVGLLQNDYSSDLGEGNKTSETTICTLVLDNLKTYGKVIGPDKSAGIIAQVPNYGGAGSVTEGIYSSTVINNCYNYADVTGDREGGILAVNGNSVGTTTITNCHNYGKLTARTGKYKVAAGIIGQVNTSDKSLYSIDANCTNNGVIDAVIGYNISANVFVNNPEDETYTFARQIVDANNVITSPSKVMDLYDTFAGGAYSNETAVRWKELEPIIGNNGNQSMVDHTGLLAGIAYDLNVETFAAVYSYDEVNGRSGLTYKFTDIDEALKRLNTQACYSNLTVNTNFEWTSTYSKEGDGPGGYSIDLNGHTMTLKAPVQKQNYLINGLQKTVTIKNGTIAYDSAYTGYIFDHIERGGHVVFENVALSGAEAGQRIISIYPSTAGTDVITVDISAANMDTFNGMKIHCESPNTGGNDVLVLNGEHITMNDSRWEEAENGTTDFTISYEARIGTTLYKTFDEAITNADNGDTIVLLKDIEPNKMYSFYSPINLTLDLNGKTITSSAILFESYDDSVNLTIKDSGKNGVIDVGAEHIVYVSSGKLVLESGNLINHSSSSHTRGVYIGSSGTFEMKGGSITIPSASTSNFNYCVTNSGVVTISGGYLVARASGGNFAICNSSGTTTITGGYVDAYAYPAGFKSPYVLYITGGNCNVSGGYFRAFGDSGTYSAGHIVDGSGTTSISGGYFGGSYYYSDHVSALASGYVSNKKSFTDPKTSYTYQYVVEPEVQNN